MESTNQDSLNAAPLRSNYTDRVQQSSAIES